VRLILLYCKTCPADCCCCYSCHCAEVRRHIGRMIACHAQLHSTRSATPAICCLAWPLWLEIGMKTNNALDVMRPELKGSVWGWVGHHLVRAWPKPKGGGLCR